MLIRVAFGVNNSNDIVIDNINVEKFLGSNDSNDSNDSNGREKLTIKHLKPFDSQVKCICGKHKNIPFEYEDN